MFRRTLLLGTVVGAAVGGPYVVSQWPKLKASVLGKPTAGSSSGIASYMPWATPAPGTTAASTVPQLDPHSQSDEIPIVDMGEAFRFDITPPWVMSRWPRVSANLQDDTLHGLRVALISGMREDDLAGSLTYYFTPQQSCTKLTFSGKTGDPGRLIQLMTSRFGFKPFTKGEPGVLRYEIRWNGNTQSELLIHSAAVVRSSTPFARYEVQLVLTDPAAR